MVQRRSDFLASGVASEVRYSNIGVALAGHLVEAVTGEAFSTVMKITFLPHLK